MLRTKNHGQRTVDVAPDIWITKSLIELNLGETKTTRVQGIGRCLPVGNISQNFVSAEPDTLRKADYTD